MLHLHNVQFLVQITVYSYIELRDVVFKLILLFFIALLLLFFHIIISIRPSIHPSIHLIPIHFQYIYIYRNEIIYSRMKWKKKRKIKCSSTYTQNDDETTQWLITFEVKNTKSNLYVTNKCLSCSCIYLHLVYCTFHIFVIRIFRCKFMTMKLRKISLPIYDFLRNIV